MILDNLEKFVESQQINLKNDLGPEERKEIIENAKLVALSLKIAVQDVESQTSSIFSIDVDESGFNDDDDDDEETELPSLNSEDRYE